MLAYILAIAIGSSSLVLFTTAFVQPEIHRKDDFFWSGIGLFYALVLWFCANRLTGGVLLGQAAAVALILSYNWQNLKLRKAIAHPEKQIALESFSVTQAIQNFFGRLLNRFRKPKTKVGVETTTTTPSATVLETEESPLEAATSQPITSQRDREEILEAQIELPTTETSESSHGLSETEIPETSTVKPEKADLSQKSESQKRSFSLKNLFSFGRKKSSPVTTAKSELSNLDAILDAELEEPASETDRTENLDVTSEPTVETTEFEAIEQGSVLDTDSEIEAVQASASVDTVDIEVETETPDLIETTEEQAKLTREEKEAINVEESASEVKLAPPAESLEEGDSAMGKNLEESSGQSQ
jgi:hypothetical protein